MMKIELTQEAIEWFKDELELPEDNKVVQFFVRYGGSFELKQGFGPAFTVSKKDDIDVGYEENYNGLNIVIAEKDVWYYEGHHLKIDVGEHDEIAYSEET
ncbi:HesB-like protein [Staphylococcus pettenkoferi VCU012]|nr:HesB-like protein [Staphylococcus pettenkoferi VCU012]